MAKSFGGQRRASSAAVGRPAHMGSAAQRAPPVSLSLSLPCLPLQTLEALHIQENAGKYVWTDGSKHGKHVRCRLHSTTAVIPNSADSLPVAMWLKLIWTAYRLKLLLDLQGSYYRLLPLSLCLSLSLSLSVSLSLSLGLRPG